MCGMSGRHDGRLFVKTVVYFISVNVYPISNIFYSKVFLVKIKEESFRAEQKRHTTGREW